MKFLLDAHLPKRLVDFFEYKGYDTIHTLDLPNKNATKDGEINSISVDEKRVLITKDFDFVDSLLISDKPYKLIYLTTGNITNKALLKLFNENLDYIVRAIKDARLIELSTDTISIKM